MATYLTDPGILFDNGQGYSTQYPEQMTTKPVNYDMSTQDMPADFASKYDASNVPTSSNTSSDKISSGGYDASEMLESAGINPSDKSRLFSQYGVDNTPDLIEAMRRAEESRLAQRKVDAEKIGKAWDPVIEELDKMIGALPGRQTEYSTQIGGLAEQQLGDVTAQEQQSSLALETEKKKGLRNLEEDIRNQMDAAGRLIGGVGGGNSSASGLASEAIVRSGQKARGSLMETVASKLTEIKNVAMQERSNIQQWKAEKLYEITRYFADKMDEFNMQKANAKGERARAVEQLKFDLEQDYVNRLRELDNTVVSYASTLDQWERERSAQLQDYASKQQATGNWTIKTAADGSLWRVNEDTGEAIQVENTVGVFKEDDESKLINAGYAQEPYSYDPNTNTITKVSGYDYLGL